MADIKHELILDCLLSEDNNVATEEMRAGVLNLSLDILRDIKKIVRNGYYNDRQAMGEIVNVLESHKIDCGIRATQKHSFEID